MNWTAKDMRVSRKYTCALLDVVDQGAVDKDTLIRDLLGWMSEDEVEQFIRRNDLLGIVGITDSEDEDE